MMDSFRRTGLNVPIRIKKKLFPRFDTIDCQHFISYLENNGAV